jgi:methionine-rich copper-binding protein CopC
MSKRFYARKEIALAAILAAVTIATPAFGHAHLSKSMPAAGATVTAPTEIVLAFSEPLEPAFSGVELSNAAGEPAAAGKAEIKDNVIRVPVKALAAGRYTVKWHVLSVDTHKTTGTFSFTVKP